MLANQHIAEAAGVEHRLSLAAPYVPILAMGAWFKNTLCVTQGHQAWVSHTVGDLDQTQACLNHEATAYHMLEQLSGKLSVIAHDLHPDFHSSRFAQTLAQALNVPLVAVQHHHAHIAAICAEHGVDMPVLGLALDGVGLGTDGAAWGGELLMLKGADCVRLSSLQPMALPGGDKAAREPWRMAASVMYALEMTPSEINSAIQARYPGCEGVSMLAQMLQRNVNCPHTTSMGRLFDAASGLLGLCSKMQYEAEAAILLEQAATAHGAVDPEAHGWRLTAEGQLSFMPLLERLLRCSEPQYGAALFHATVAHGLAEWLYAHAEQQSIQTVALGGGCFFNQILRQQLPPLLEAKGMRVMMPKQLLPGDTAISLGQAWVANQLLLKGALCV